MDQEKSIWNIRATDEFLTRLRITAKVLDRPASQLVREAVNEKIDELIEQNPKVARALESV